MIHAYVPRIDNLEQQYQQIKRHVSGLRGCGDLGSSSTLRIDIHERKGFQPQDPNQLAAEDYHNFLIDLGLIEESLPA
jgi:hypothetical protein